MVANGYILAAYIVSFGLIGMAIAFVSWRLFAARAALMRAERMRG
jgi:hypothetical protein